MENQVNPFVAFLPLLILSLPVGIACWRLCVQKGLSKINVLLAFIPVANVYALIFCVGSSRIKEQNFS